MLNAICYRLIGVNLKSGVLFPSAKSTQENNNNNNEETRSRYVMNLEIYLPLRSEFKIYSKTLILKYLTINLIFDYYRWFKPTNKTQNDNLSWRDIINTNF